MPGDRRSDINLLKDASFENLENTLGAWNASKEMEIIPVASGAKDGKYVCLLKPKKFAQSITQTFSCVEDKNLLNSTIYFGVWVRADNEPANIRLSIAGSGSPENPSRGPAIYTNVSKKWQFLTVRTKIGSTCTKIAASIYPDDGYHGESANNIYIDGAIVTKKKLNNIFAKGTLFPYAHRPGYAGFAGYGHPSNRPFADTLAAMGHVLKSGSLYLIIIVATVTLLLSLRFKIFSSENNISLSKYIVDTSKTITPPIAVGLLLVMLSTSNPPPIYRVYCLIPPLQLPPAVYLTDFSGITVLFLGVNYLIISLFGYLLAYRFFSRLGVSPFVEFIASFFVGYLCIIPLIRILSFAIRYEHIYPPVIMTVLAYIYLQLSRQPDSIPRLFRLRSDGESRTNCYILLFLSLVLFFSVLLLQICQGDFGWFGHGNVHPLLGEWQSRGSHFPVVTQHYEDLIFHYFLTISLGAPLSFSVVPWWLSLGLLKVSAFALLYALFRKTGVSFYLAIVFCIYMMLGTPSLLPTKYYAIVNDAYPIYFIPLSGRLLGIIFFIFMIVYGACETKENHLPKLYFILAGMGLTAIILPNALWVVLFYFLTIVFKYYYSHLNVEKKYTTRLESISGRSIAYGSIFVSLLLYGLPFDNRSAHLLRLFLILLIFALLAIRVTPKVLYALRRKFAHLENRNAVAQIVILTLSVGAGLAFLGNLLVVNGLSDSLFMMLGKAFGGTEICGVFDGHATLGKLELGDYRQLASGSSYNWGLPQFAASYGAILSMILISDYLFTKNRHTLSIMEYTLYENFLIASASVPIFLWFTDFLSVLSHHAWDKARFLELPVYYIVFYFLFSLNRFVRSRVKIIIAVILIIYSVTPFLATERHKQIYVNWLFFEHMIKK